MCFYYIFYRYTAVYVLCHLCDSRRPMAISIINNSTESKPRNIFYLPDDEVIMSKEPTKTSPEYMYKYAACISPIHARYNRSLALVEWVELNRILGIEYFVFYVIDVTEDVMHILRFYEQVGIASVVPWNIEVFVSKDDLDYFAQQAALNDCLFQIHEIAEHIVFTDLDEYIVPQKINDYTFDDMLVQLPDESVFMFRHAYFKTDTRYNDVTLNTQEFTLRCSNIPVAGVQTKVIVKTNALYQMGVHDTWQILYGERHVVDPDIGLLHHYRLSNYGNGAKFVIDTSANKYYTELIGRVQHVAGELKTTYKHKVINL